MTRIAYYKNIILGNIIPDSFTMFKKYYYSGIDSIEKKIQYINRTNKLLYSKYSNLKNIKNDTKISKK